jgi:hypothetical protein
MQIVKTIREWRYAGTAAAFAACFGAGFLLTGAKVGGSCFLCGYICRRRSGTALVGGGIHREPCPQYNRRHGGA